MRVKTIGIFDSGIGGLSVLAKAREMMPDVDFIYYADTEHVPYGTKSREEIVNYSVEAAKFLIKKGAEAILVACNTATSMAVDTLRAVFDCPVVGMEPAVKPAVSHHPHERILVCATPATIGGEKLHELLRRNAEGAEVDLCALPELVVFAENGIFDSEIVSAYIRSRAAREDYSACVLGCTHFPYFKDSFRLVFPYAEMIDGTEGTVRRLCHVTGYERESSLDRGTVKYYNTGAAVSDTQTLAFYEELQRRVR
ncbi:MAG: glutamate racemase [Ruminococcaceae bacterium]|nr:glutamate racemase [Oscillospiraceae bacterium]